MAVSIRRAETDDLGSVQDLLVRTWHHTYDHLYGVEKVTEITDLWHSIDALRRQIETPDSVFLNAYQVDRMVGTLFMTREPDGAVMLNRLYVLPGEQRQGIGRSLFDAAMIEAKQPKIVRLEVDPDNMRAVQSYHAMGFTVTGQVSNCGGGDSGIPAQIMTLQRP